VRRRGHPSEGTLLIVTRLWLVWVTVVLGCGSESDTEPRAETPAEATPSAPKREGPVEVRGNRMYLDPDDQAITPWLRKGVWEPLETMLFEGEIEAGDIVVDVGANVGYYTLIAANKVGPQGRVYAFEPDPDAFALLQANIELNALTNVVAIDKALAAEPGRMELFRSSSNLGDHRLYDPGDGRTAVTVEVTTMDAALADVRGIDLIKIDTQGAECSILAGAGAVLERERDAGIIMEYTPKFIRAFGQEPAACLKRLEGLGFEFYDILEFAERKGVVKVPLEAILDQYAEASERYTNLFLPSRDKVASQAESSAGAGEG
jgi:FkbM family methyltransferase